MIIDIQFDSVTTVGLKPLETIHNFNLYVESSILLHIGTFIVDSNNRQITYVPAH